MKLGGFRFGVFLALCMGPSSAAPVEGILEQHNVYRCMHNADSVTYSTVLEADAQDYADTLAGACGGLTTDPTLDDTTGENLSLCLLVPDPEDACSSGSVAVPRWYGEVTFYAEDASGTGISTNPSRSITQFSQLVWKSTTQIGCASSSCDITSSLQVTYVVCRYQVAGNVATQYGANVEGTASRTFEDCIADVGGNGDPHMSGFKGQKFDFTGKEDTWYALIHDRDIAINMRITAPVPDVQAITYITGLGISLMGTDSIMHTVEIVIDNPHDLNPICDKSNSAPCLADGALTILVDGEPAGAGQVGLDGGVAVSALNIPGECRPFGFEKYWLDKQEAADHRSLLAAFSPGMWLKKDTKRTDPDACDNYIDEASATGTLFDHQSEHASFQITSPSLSFRVNVGKVHQLAMRDPTDNFDLPDHVAYQMNVVFETVGVSDTSQGILGETVIPTVDEEGLPIMKGLDCIRGQENDYVVSHPLDTNFSLNL